MAVIEFFLWLVICLIPLALGFIFLLYPQKVIQIRARMQYGMFRSLGMDDEKIDKSPFYSVLYDEGYSKILKSQQDNPHDFRFLMAWVRILGFGMLFFGATSVTLIILVFNPFVQ